MEGEKARVMAFSIWASILGDRALGGGGANEVGCVGMVGLEGHCAARGLAAGGGGGGGVRPLLRMFLLE